MGRVIDSIVVGGVPDGRLKLTAAQVAAVLSFGSSWTTLRMGIRYSMSDVSDNPSGTPELWMGVLANPASDVSNGPLYTTSHFLGGHTVSASWTRNTGPTRYTTPANWRGELRIGTTNNAGAGSAGQILNTSAVDSVRGVWMIEISKNGTTFSLKGLACSTGGNLADISLATFKSAMVKPALSDAVTVLGSTAYSSGSAATWTIDEPTNGFFNSICLAWSKFNPVLQVSDFLFCKMN